MVQFRDKDVLRPDAGEVVDALAGIEVDVRSGGRGDKVSGGVNAAVYSHGDVVGDFLVGAAHSACPNESARGIELHHKGVLAAGGGEVVDVRAGEEVGGLRETAA